MNIFYNKYKITSYIYLIFDVTSNQKYQSKSYEPKNIKEDKILRFWKIHLNRISSFKGKCNNLVKPITELTQTAITCSKLTLETLEQGVKYVQS